MGAYSCSGYKCSKPHVCFSVHPPQFHKGFVFILKLQNAPSLTPFLYSYTSWTQVLTLPNGPNTDLSGFYFFGTYHLQCTVAYWLILYLPTFHSLLLWPVSIMFAYSNPHQRRMYLRIRQSAKTSTRKKKSGYKLHIFLPFTYLLHVYSEADSIMLKTTCFAVRLHEFTEYCPCCLAA